MIVSKNPLSSHGAEFLDLVLDLPFVLGRLSILTRFLVMGVPTFFNLLRGIVIGFFLTMALSKMSEHGAGIVAVVQTRQPGVDGLV